MNTSIIISSDILEIVRKINPGLVKFLELRLKDRLIENYFHQVWVMDLFNDMVNMRRLVIGFDFYNVRFIKSNDEFEYLVDLNLYNYMNVKKYMEIINLDLVPDVIMLIIKRILDFESIEFYSNNQGAIKAYHYRMYYTGNHLLDLINEINSKIS